MPREEKKKKKKGSCWGESFKKKKGQHPQKKLGCNFRVALFRGIGGPDIKGSPREKVAEGGKAWGRSSGREDIVKNRTKIRQEG